MLNKITVSLIIISLVAGFSLPFLTVAQEDLPEQCTLKVDMPGTLEACGAAGTVVGYDDDITSGGKTFKGAMCCLFNGVYYATNWIFTGLLALVVVLVMVGAYYILTAAGDTNKVTSGRNYIMYAAIGLVVALFARIVPIVARMITGV